MARKKLMNTSGTLAHDTGSPVSGGTFVITSSPSVKVKAVGPGVYFGTLSFTFSGGTYTGGIPGTAQGRGTIAPTATKEKEGSNFPIREDDTGTMSGTYQQTAPPYTVPFSGAPVKVSSAGQTKVLGE
jgi:hypothetical protein